MIAATGNQKLPQDRESVYWFNILQIPPSNLEGTENKNRMLIMLRTRETFLSPGSIITTHGTIKKLKGQAAFGIGRQGVGVEIANPQSRFVSITDITLTVVAKNEPFMRIWLIRFRSVLSGSRP